ncbi:THO complex subunit 7 homolog [Hydractinia symbiolongicarpus]|uniref:THO complex subunit 7 homolog n=1 Tax=Hydractinia symbiolongicarpus TaxID=13093 RepID=UPI00254B4CB6|nr:THO complex subunit 7 homolog [Hydractinia symbiolongicarpus]
MAVSEDDIIRRRLLYDGDGTGEEKRITTILKTIIKWSTADFDDEERNLTYQKIVALLRQCEYSMTKHHLAYLMNTEERDNYEKLYQQIQGKIVEAKKDIALCKEELQQAKIIRRNKQEYDSLARIIEKHPERKITEREIQSLEKEISELNARMHKLMQKLEMRQKQFHVLVYSVQLLQQILEDDDDGSELSSSHTKQSDVRTPIEVMDLT